MTNIKDFIKLSGIVVLMLMTAFVFFWYSERAQAQITVETNVPANTFRTMQFFATSTVQTVYATSTNATSTNIAAYADSNGRIDNGSFTIAGAKKVTLYFTRGGAFGAETTGTSTFSIQVTPDGTNWYNFNKLISATSTTQTNANVQANTFIDEPAGNTATTTLVYSMDLSAETYLGIRCIIVTTVSGAASCQASASF